jgi:hypothetical protein
MEVDPLEIADAGDGENGRERTKSRLNNLVAVSVAILATFMGLCKVKDDNIVQSMEAVQAKQIDEWSYYQARNIREEVASSTLALLTVQAQSVPPEKRAPVSEQMAIYQSLAAEQHSKKATNKENAEQARNAYDEFNYHDDQFDLSDAMLAIAISMMALTSLTQKRWLYWIAMIPTVLGLLMGMAGLLGWHIHSDLAAKWLGS